METMGDATRVLNNRTFRSFFQISALHLHDHASRGWMRFLLQTAQRVPDLPTTDIATNGRRKMKNVTEDGQSNLNQTVHTPKMASKVARRKYPTAWRSLRCVEAIINTIYRGR